MAHNPVKMSAQYSSAVQCALMFGASGASISHRKEAAGISFFVTSDMTERRLPISSQGTTATDAVTVDAGADSNADIAAHVRRMWTLTTTLPPSFPRGHVRSAAFGSAAATAPPSIFFPGLARLGFPLLCYVSSLFHSFLPAPSSSATVSRPHASSASHACLTS